MFAVSTLLILSNVEMKYISNQNECQQLFSFILIVIQSLLQYSICLLREPVMLSVFVDYRNKFIVNDRNDWNRCINMQISMATKQKKRVYLKNSSLP